MKMLNFYRYPEEGHLIDFEITEKLDGANFRFQFKKNGTMVFGSRNVSPITGDATAGDSSSPKSFRQYIEHVDIQTLGRTITEEYFHCVFFAEAMVPHKIKYFIGEPNKVIGFAVYDLIENKWRSDWKKMFEAIGLPTTKVFTMNGTPEETVQRFEKWVKDGEIKSFVDQQSPIEGIVMADYENQVFYKWKTAAFLEVAMEKKVKVAKFDSFIEKYATEYRMEHILMQMKDEETFSPKNPVNALIGHVIKDIFEEAEMVDIRKAFGKLVQNLVARTITQNPNIMKQLMELKE